MGPGMTNVINLYTYYLNKTLEEWHAIQYGHLKNGIRHPTKTWWHDATSSWNLPRKFTDVQQYYLWKSWNCRGGRKAIQQLKSQKAQRDIHCEKVAQTAKCVLHFDIDKDICFHSRLQHDVRTTWPHFKWDSSGIGSNVNAMLDCSVYSAEAIRALCLYG